MSDYTIDDTCPWCGGKDKSVRPIRKSLGIHNVRCMNDWHDAPKHEPWRVVEPNIYTIEDAKRDLRSMLMAAQQYRALHRDWNRVPMPDDAYPTVLGAEDAEPRLLTFIEQQAAEIADLKQHNADLANDCTIFCQHTKEYAQEVLDLRAEIEARGEIINTLNSRISEYDGTPEGLRAEIERLREKPEVHATVENGVLRIITPISVIIDKSGTWLGEVESESIRQAAEEATK